MKTLLSLAVAALTSTSLHAQHLTPAQVPAPVSTAFAQAFPRFFDSFFHEMRMEGFHHTSGRCAC